MPHRSVSVAAWRRLSAPASAWPRRRSSGRAVPARRDRAPSHRLVAAGQRAAVPGVRMAKPFAARAHVMMIELGYKYHRDHNSQQI
eukprot:1750342-Pleurochrysis_carterae.AAC.3